MAQKFGRTMPDGPIKPPRIGALDATLRNEFAMVALHAMASSGDFNYNAPQAADIISETCYAIADVMMRARERKV